MPEQVESVAPCFSFDLSLLKQRIEHVSPEVIRVPRCSVQSAKNEVIRISKPKFLRKELKAPIDERETETRLISVTRLPRISKSLYLFTPERPRVCFKLFALIGCAVDIRQTEKLLPSLPSKSNGYSASFIYGEIEGGVYVHGGGIDVQDATVLKGCEHLLRRKRKRQLRAC